MLPIPPARERFPTLRPVAPTRTPCWKTLFVRAAARKILECFTANQIDKKTLYRRDNPCILRTSRFFRTTFFSNHDCSPQPTSPRLRTKIKGDDYQRRFQKYKEAEQLRKQAEEDALVHWKFEARGIPEYNLLAFGQKPVLPRPITETEPFRLSETPQRKLSASAEKEQSVVKEFRARPVPESL